MKSKFEKFVETTGGPYVLAKRLGLLTHSVRVWTRGDGAPKLKTIAKLVKMSGGKLTWESIARDTTRRLKGGERIR